MLPISRCFCKIPGRPEIYPAAIHDRATHDPAIRDASTEAMNAVDLMCRCMPQGASLTSAEQKPFTEELCKHRHRPTGLGLFQR